MKAHRGPWYGLEPFHSDVVPTIDAFSVMAAVDRLDCFLNESQACEAALMQVMEDVSILVYRGQVTFVFGLLHPEFLVSEALEIDRPNQAFALDR